MRFALTCVLLCLCFLRVAAAVETGYAPVDLAVLTATASAPPSSYALTNYVGCVAWYDPEIAPPSTNGSVVTLPDLAWYHFDLTNASATSTWPIRKTAGLNSYATLESNSKNLRNAILAASQPVDVFLVAALTNRSITVYSDAGTATGFQFLKNSGNLQMNAGTTFSVGDAAGITNAFVVINLQYNGASSKLLTNNVQRATGNAGANSLTGFTIGAQYNFSFASSLEWATVAIFTNLSSGDRTSVFSALTNRYNIAVQ